MYLIVTRTFPPEVGGMQNLMWGLARSLSKINLIKVIADYKEGHEEFDNSVSFSIERVKGIKILRKYRKSYLINEYLNKNPKIQCVIADHWKSLELIKTKNKKICLIHSKEINHKKGSRINKKILEVLYPFKKNTQRYKMWKKYYSGASGLLGLKIKSKNKKSVIKFVNSLKLFGYGYSWGGFESLALYQDIREQGKRKFFNLLKNEHLVRLHIGLEDPKDLIQDLKRSLRFIK